MPLYAEALQRILPDGGELYLALLVAPPGIDGTGETEATYPGYARVLHTDWATHTDGSGWYASNTGTAVFPALLAGAAEIRAWGIYLDGKPDLVASGLITNSVGDPIVVFLGEGDQARFLDDALKIRTGG